MRLKKLLALLLTLMMVVSMFTVTATTVSAANTGKIKNVIYMIPDGGGMEPFWLADAVKEAGGMNTDLFPYVTPQTVDQMYLRDYLVAGMTTHAANADITDSAAAGTAMAIGYKTNLYQIGLDSSYNPKANILEAAQLSGRKTGLVTRYEFAHATPAAFSAHAANRSDYRMMAEQIINQGIDVVLSPGLYNNVCQFEDGLDTITNMGYTLINSKYDLANIQQGDRVWSYMPTYSFDYQNTAASPTLAEMTDAAIRALECDEGFFMMVEGSSVDTGGHDNNALEMIGNYIAFDEACKIAIEYAKGRTDTVVMVAPDHDTGGLNILDESAAVSSLQSGVNPSSSAITWTSKEHTARNGGVFLYVPDGISYPTGASSNPGVASNFDNYTIDNVDLAHYLADCMGFDLDDATDELFVNISSLGTYSKTYDSESQTSNYTGTFTFNNSDCTIEANQSYATIDGERVSLDGQVAFYEYNTGKFYAPQKLLNYLDGTEVPDEDATTGGGTAGNNSLITQTSITSMGTAATFWGNVATYENVTNNDNTSITIQPGGYATFNVPVANSGIYYLQVKSSGGDTTLEMVVNDEYYAEMPVYSTEQDYYLNNGEYEFLYMPAGKAAVKFTNIGNEACTVSDIRLVASQNAVNAGVTPTMASVKRRAVWLGASQNQVDHYNGYTSGASYSTTLAPGAYAKISVSGLPYSGIYGLQLKLSSVSGTANIRAFSGDGYYGDYEITEAGVWTNRMSPARDCPIYFESGSNTLYIKNTGSTNFTFQEFDLARMDAGDSFDFKYLLKATTTLPDGTTVSPSLTPAKAEWAYAAQNQDGYFNGYTSDGEPEVTLAPGEFTTITVTDIPYTGVYAFQLRLPTISGTANVRVTTDKGYYGDYAITEANTWTNRMTPGQDQPIYFTEGTNTFYIENTGTTSFYLKDYDIGRLDAGNSMDFAYLLKQTDTIPGDGTDTTTPTATPTPTTAPTATPTPTPTISADASAWTGRFSDVTSHKNGYVGENYAMTTFTNGDSAVEGVDYQASSSAAFNSDGSFTMVVGDWGKYEITVPYTGVYAMQVYTLWIGGNGSTTLKVSTEDGYYTEHALTGTGWSSGYYQDQPIYLTEGTNIITIELMGDNNCTLAAIDLGRLDVTSAEASLDYLPLVKTETVVEPTPTPTPTATPTPTPTPTYVPGDADEWTGKFGDVESHNNGYVGEIYAMTTFTKTNGSSSVAGVDYKASASSPFGSSGAFTMVVGDWGQYEVSVPYTGVYAMQLQTSWIGGTGTARLMVSADTGYYSIHDLAHATWTSGSYADQPIYLEAGTNIITIKLLGENNCILSGIDFGRLDKNGETASLDYLPLVNVKEDKFTNLKIDGASATATVTYQKFYDDAAATLYLGEYDTETGKLLNINLVTIDTETEQQEVNAFDTYSVSIPNATGDLKAMLLDETLKPVITEAKLQEATRLTGKKVSILGDSISTYIGYSNNTAYNSTIGNNAVYYNGYYQGFKDVNETWWKQMIDQTGMELLVNNSYSGDKVCTNGISRALELDNNENVNPDVIVVYLGVNDIIGGCSTSEFTTNYNTMISGMRNKYPNAEIYLMTFPYFQNSSVGSYCDIVEQTAATYNCTFVDLYRDSGITSANVADHMVDGFLHPNYAGMDKITDCLVDAMLAE